MKGILNLIIASIFVLVASTSMAATKTAMDSKWICTTNASSSSLEADKTADKQLASKSSSATNSFAAAAKNCRDCTKITCEAQSQ